MPDPIMDLRRQLAAEIVRSLGPNSHYLLAPLCGIPQPRMSQLSRGNVERFSIEWLIRRIDRLGGTVTITVTLGNFSKEWHRQRFRETRERLAAERGRPAAGTARATPAPRAARSAPPEPARAAESARARGPKPAGPYVL